VFVQSPEVHFYQPYDHKADIYSVGITALLLARKLEITAEPSMKHLTALDRSKWDPHFNAFVLECIKPGDQRPEATQLLQVPLYASISLPSYLTLIM